MKKLLFSISIFAILACALSAHAALPQPAVDFEKGALFTVSGYNGTETLSGFPVLVRIAENNPVGFSYGGLHSPEDGADLAFIDMDGTGLPFEIDTWNTNGTSLVWVRLPSMTNGTEFVMCWGSLFSGKTVCSDNPWTDFTGVWHLNESPGGITTVTDSTTNGLDGTTVASSSAVSDAPIGGARHVTTDSQHTPGLDSGITIDLADAAKRAAVDGLGNEFSASMWVRVTADFRYFYLVSRKNSDNDPAWGAQTLNQADGAIRLYSAGQKDGESANPVLDVALANKNEWHKIDFVWKSDGTYEIYQDGGSKLAGDLYQKNPAVQGVRNLSLGGALENTAKGGRGLNGDLDEVRLRAFVPTAAWVAADHTTQKDPDFLAVRAVESYHATVAPKAGILVPTVAYTNATVEAFVSSLGEGATSANVLVQLAGTEDFSSPFWTTNYTISNAEIRTFEVSGLSTGAVYHARVIVTNNLDAGVEPDSIRFEMLVPGAPSGDATLGETGFTTQSATATLSELGVGATCATVRLEASTDPDFATVVTGAESVASVGEETALSISGLTPAATYHVRVRLVNDWGIETFLPLGETTLLDVPMDGTGPAWTFSEDNTLVSFAFDVTSIWDGAYCTASLHYDDRTFALQNFSTTGTISWLEVPAAAIPTTASIVVQYTKNGAIYSKTWTTDRKVAPDGFYLYVDALADEGGNGYHPESPVQTIGEALALAQAGASILVRGGADRPYEIATAADRLLIREELEGLSILPWGNDGAPEIVVSTNYAVNAGPAPVVTNAAEQVRIEDFRFSFTKDSLGTKNDGPACNLIQNSAPFLTLSGCEFRLVGELPDGSLSRTLNSALISSDSFSATNMLVEGCSFFNCRKASRNTDCTLVRIRDNARFVGNVFSNVSTILTGIQLTGNRCTGPCSFVSNVVYQAGGENHRGVFGSGFAGPGQIEISYNRFVNDDEASPIGSILRKSREGFAYGLVFHHNTVVGFSEFIFADNLGYYLSSFKGEVFDNIFVHSGSSTSIVENSVCPIQEYTGSSLKPTIFLTGSFYRNNALFAGVFNGGTATTLEWDGWTYDITAGLSIENTFVLGTTTIPAGEVIPAPLPVFADTDDLFSPDFYRPMASRQKGSFNYGKVGWTGDNGEYPEYIGALPSRYPAETMLILR